MNAPSGTPEIITTLSTTLTQIRGFYSALARPEIRGGLTSQEVEKLVKAGRKAERLVLEAVLEMHGMQGILLSTSVRWLDNEDQGNNPAGAGDKATH